MEKRTALKRVQVNSFAGRLLSPTEIYRGHISFLDFLIFIIEQRYSHVFFMSAYFLIIICSRKIILEKKNQYNFYALSVIINNVEIFCVLEIPPKYKTNSKLKHNDTYGIMKYKQLFQKRNLNDSVATTNDNNRCTSCLDRYLF